MDRLFLSGWRARARNTERDKLHVNYISGEDRERVHVGGVMVSSRFSKEGRLSLTEQGDDTQSRERD